MNRVTKPACASNGRARRWATAVEPLENRTLLAATTNDPYFASQYALANSAVAGAWQTTRGSAAMVVADTDTGADYTHQDLYENVWINQAEIPSYYKARLRDTDRDGRISFYDLNAAGNRSLMTDVNGNGYIDGGDLLQPVSAGGWDDGVNGRSNANDTYTDDIIGWDFAESDNNPYDDGTANSGHGTHTAGIMGAVGNNGVGISGVSQKLSMMIVRIFADSGTSVSDSTLAAAIRYTADSGARAVNASWGGPGGRNGDAIYNAIRYAGNKGELFVTAAGNDGRNLDSRFFNDFPAEYSLDNILVVGATTASGTLASFSNYGVTKVDLTAPGSGILSTLPGGNRYGQLSGTSMATPMVTGAAALTLAADPSLTVSELKTRLMSGADRSVALGSSSLTGAQLDVNNAVLGRSGSQLSTASVATSATETATAATASTEATSVLSVRFDAVFSSVRVTAAERASIAREILA